MADFLGLMKQAAELKSKMETMQAELDRIEVEGSESVKTVEQYLRHAAECDLLLQGSRTDTEREMIRNMAETWRMLAEGRRKMLEQRSAGVDDGR